MLTKCKYYYNTRFPIEVIEEAYKLFLKKLEKMKVEEPNYDQRFTIYFENEIWDLDSLDDFLADIPKSKGFELDQYLPNIGGFDICCRNNFTMCRISFKYREDINSIFNIFEKKLDSYTLIVPSEPIKIFIGHGNSPQWRDLKDHLHEQHEFDVIHYEIGPRAGLSIKEVLENMLNKSSIAFLVLTGEDIGAYGELHARENVIHEAGLFQGRLGFSRAILLLEKDVHEFSNIYGLNQIRFSMGNIKETFGYVLSTIKREFEK